MIATVIAAVVAPLLRTTGMAAIVAVVEVTGLVAAAVVVTRRRRRRYRHFMERIIFNYLLQPEAKQHRSWQPMTLSPLKTFNQVSTSTRTRTPYLVLYNFALPLLFVVRYDLNFSNKVQVRTCTGIYTVLYWFWLWASLPHLEGMIQMTSFFIFQTQRPILTPWLQSPQQTPDPNATAQ